jgi:hypothetical protein
MNAIYPTFGLDGVPDHRWDLPPFSGQWPASVFGSLDGVANESVSIDFFRAEWDNAPDIEYADQYMHEAALADNPPSGTMYDPDGDGVGSPSLGVHEHWNNSTDKQYSRNLGTGDGIELVYVGPDTPPPTGSCGDGACDSGETCSSCEADCGACTGTGGSSGTGGTGTGGSGTGGAATGGTTTGGAPTAGDAGTTGITPASSGADDSGCGCRVPRSRGPNPAAAFAALLALGLLARRRARG